MRPPHQPSEWEQILFAGTPDLYHRSPKTGDFQHKSRSLEEAVCDHDEGSCPKKLCLKSDFESPDRYK